jgi:hypothetical protein
MNTYPNSAYGFCEDCHMTVIPATLEYEGGLHFTVCPNCAGKEFEDAESIIPDRCTFGGCHRVAVGVCPSCEDAMCSFHDRGGWCDVCAPMQSYTRGWTASGFGRDY